MRDDDILVLYEVTFFDEALLMAVCISAGAIKPLCNRIVKKIKAMIKYLSAVISHHDQAQVHIQALFLESQIGLSTQFSLL